MRITWAPLCSLGTTLALNKTAIIYTVHPYLRIVYCIRQPIKKKAVTSIVFQNHLVHSCILYYLFIYRASPASCRPREGSKSPTCVACGFSFLFFYFFFPLPLTQHSYTHSGTHTYTIHNVIHIQS